VLYLAWIALRSALLTAMQVATQLLWLLWLLSMLWLQSLLSMLSMAVERLTAFGAGIGVGRQRMNSGAYVTPQAPVNLPASAHLRS
jgi:hypothetical protein